MRMRRRKWVTPFLSEKHDILYKDNFPIGQWIQKSEYKAIYLEIGMGMGDFLLETAPHFKDILFIGLEKDETCVAKVIKKAQDLNLTNFKIIMGDAKNLDMYFAKEEVQRIYLHFCDPWPKKAHHKRRLTSSSFLAIYQYILASDGDLIFKTDNKDLFEFSLISFNQANCHLEEVSVDYHRQEHLEALTAYERKFIKEGLPIYFAHLKLKC